MRKRAPLELGTIAGLAVTYTSQGVAVLLISAELDEIMALSDRIAVMYRGQIVAIVETKKATREQLGLWMAGAHVETAS